MSGKKKYMREALKLARRGGGNVNPNPLVGAVVVKEDRIVGRGYHREYGGPHAEVNALAEAGDKARDAHLYVTLEPCIHEGKTPPCVDLVLQRELSKVFVSSLDPNPRVNGRGVEKLREEGVDVQVGMLEEESSRMNEIYFKYIKTERPFVQLKLALSMDGKIATSSGDSRWISSSDSRKEVHRMRARYSSVLVGIGTVIADDPRLTVRKVDGPQPKRLVLDSEAKIPGDANLLTDGKGETVVVTKENAPRKEKLKGSKVKQWKFPDRRGEVALSPLMDKLGEEGHDSLLVEGGSEIAWSLLEEGLIDKFSFFFSPKVIGGRDAVPAIGGKGFSTVKDSLKLAEVSWERSGEDLWLRAYPAEHR